jgi:lipopolysaccharide biosynthesis regulator YciM
MEFELWWLLAIPLFFALGWLAHRIESRHAARASSQVPDAYFKGLNYLLNEQSDKAIDAFVDVMKVDPETVELHFALGNLLRRRGETDRAIRVHQNLVDRAGLPAAQREHALFELGQDFLRAGLLDRAEDAFIRLESTTYAGAALRHRLDIAQTVRDWPQAIALAARLQGEGRDDLQPLIAHLHCELAQQLLGASTPASPERQAQIAREIDHALEADRKHPRPWLLRGEAAMAADDCEAAVAAWTELARVSPAHLALIADRWLDAHERLGRLSAGIADLEAMLGEPPPVDALRAIAQARARRDGSEAAVAWLRQALERNPSLLGLQQLLELRRTVTSTSGASSDAHEADMALSAVLIRRQANRLSRYVCGHCGFKARRHYWQCPGCSRWDTYAPRRTEELESDGAA